MSVCKKQASWFWPSRHLISNTDIWQQPWSLRPLPAVEHYLEIWGVLVAKQLWKRHHLDGTALEKASPWWRSFGKGTTLMAQMVWMAKQLWKRHSQSVFFALEKAYQSRAFGKELLAKRVGSWMLVSLVQFTPLTLNNLWKRIGQGWSLWKRALGFVQVGAGRNW